MASGRGSWLSRGGHAQQRGKGATVAPLYKRLPHGPHRMGREEVIAHQRSRIHGAMVEAIAAGGYDGTSVKQVIGLAGVSRRSFYEQFANKEECFLATFDLIARRNMRLAMSAYLEAEGSWEERLRTVFRLCAGAMVKERKPTILVVLETQAAGPAGVQRLLSAAAVCEQMLAHSLADAPGAGALPAPIVRAMLGGLHGVASSILRDVHVGARVDAAEELLRWIAHFPTPIAAELAEHLAAETAARVRGIALADDRNGTAVEERKRDERARLHESVLRLAAAHGYHELTAPQIAEEANVSIDAFCELFTDKRQCLLAALDMIAEELLAIVADANVKGADWPRAVRRALAELMCYLAAHPLHARTIAQEAFFADPDAFERTVELSRSVAVLLTAGAPSAGDGSLTTEGVAGAIWHTVRCQVAAGRTRLLPALADHLTYVVLTPFVGADAASAALKEDRDLASFA